MTIGERIKEARIAKGYSQAQLAELIGYKSRSSINKIETGERTIPNDVLEKFAEVLGIPYMELVLDQIDLMREANDDQRKWMQELSGDERRGTYKYILMTAAFDNLELLALYCNLSPAGQDEVMEYLRNMFDEEHGSKARGA